ncbi:MAG: hypothetical protein AAGC55_26335, partial [Myxococcota bacterium]
IGDEVRITVIATGFDRAETERQRDSDRHRMGRAPTQPEIPALKQAARQTGRATAPPRRPAAQASRPAAPMPTEHPVARPARLRTNSEQIDLPYSDDLLPSPKPTQRMRAISEPHYIAPAEGEYDSLSVTQVDDDMNSIDRALAELSSPNAVVPATMDERSRAAMGTAPTIPPPVSAPVARPAAQAQVQPQHHVQHAPHGIQRPPMLQAQIVPDDSEPEPARVAQGSGPNRADNREISEPMVVPKPVPRRRSSDFPRVHPSLRHSAAQDGDSELDVPTFIRRQNSPR